MLKNRKIIIYNLLNYLFQFNIIERLPIKNSVEEEFNLTSKYYFPPDIQMLYVLPYKGLFGSHPRVRIRNSGEKKPETKRCGFVLSDQALYLFRKREIIDIPFNEIKRCGLSFGNSAKKVKSYEIILNRGHEQYSISFPFIRKIAVPFLKLLNQYINSKIA